MAAFIDLLAKASRPVLWLDADAYAGRLMAGGAVPWLDAAGFIAWQRKAQGLLKSDVVALPLASVCEAWLLVHPELKTSMAEKRRAVFPLKVLLSDQALRAHLVELVAGMRVVFSALPLALIVPSPRAWIAVTYAQAHGAEAEVEIGDDEADSASMYLADFLRSFADSKADVLLLDEKGEAQPVTTTLLSCYQPLSNVAQHYRWDLGLRASSAGIESCEGAELGFVIAAAPIANIHTGVDVPLAFWEGAEAPAAPSGGFRFVTIPEQAKPEIVLEHLGGLR